jgi:3-hydroxyisobutyrate dehydrogenase-like beta-hydroxyacid dehydrogenase
MTSTHRVGWLGTGRMGVAMTTRLINHGFDVTVWNRTAAKAAPLVELGAKQAEDVAELATCDIVFTMVTSSPDLLAVTLGEDGLLVGEHSPRILVDCSTVSAESAGEVRAAAAERNVAFLSAPISGNPAMIAEGGGAIVASGPAEVLDEVKPYLQAIGPTVVRCGDAEEARLVKLCHNLLLGLITESLVEVTTLAAKGGVSPDSFLDFINGTVLGSSFIMHKGNAIRAHDYTPTFTTRNLRKDFELGLAAARSHEVAMPLAAATQQLIQTSIGHGHGDEDYVALYQVAARAAGLDVHGAPS